MPAPTAAPLTAAKRRKRASGDAQEAFVDRTEAGLAGLGQIAEVGAGAKGRRGTGDNDRSDRRIGLDLVHRGDDLVDHCGGQRVAFGGVVEGQRGHTFGTRDEHERHDYTVRHG